MKDNFTLTSLLLACCISIGFAQESTNKIPYNKWSIEINTGQNKAIKPFATGYYSSDPTKAINFSGINHFDIGVRYMFSDAFGVKFDYGMDKFTNLKNAGSLTFNTQQNRFGLQGVMNLGRLLHFESFTNRLGILAHAGVHISKFSVNEGINNGISESNGGMMFGITPQIRLSKSLALTADFSAINNVRQHLNWDGSTAATKDNLSGMLYNTSLGLTLYLGKKEKHADWYSQKDALTDLAAVDNEARKRIENIETLMNDTDRDGVVDYLDAENNTPSGVQVDAKGRFIDTNKNGTPDEMEPSIGKETTYTQINKFVSAENQLIENGLINVFFDINSDVPNGNSNNSLNIILHYMQTNSNAKVKLLGYADEKGSDLLNIKLSMSRANSVLKFLVENNINPANISIEAMGVDKFFSNKSQVSVNLARRVSFQINK